VPYCVCVIGQNSFFIKGGELMNTKVLSLDSQVCQSPGNIVSDMDGEKVMLSVKNSKYYNLGSIGGEIWELINEPTTPKMVISKLLRNFNVDKNQCEQEVMLFLDDLVKQDLIIIHA
jgi:hypothetical protein